PAGNSLYSYEWKKDGTVISGAVTSMYTVTHPGLYSVKVTLSSGGCNSTTSAQITQGCREAEINLADKPKHYSVFPNPLSSFTTISFYLEKSQAVSVKIVD